MAEKPAEEYKRICLICGCHTNQAIDIYQPKNGPNILELIQAKFKFRPANEDKYLCFSCNNWLINWHSIENVTNQPGSREGKLRSQINDSIPEEDSDESSSSGTYKSRNYQFRNSLKKRMGFYFSRRCLSLYRKVKRSRKKYQLCCICNKHVKRKLFSKNRKTSLPHVVKCMKCAKIVYQRRYTNYILEKKRKLLHVRPKLELNHSSNWKNIERATSTSVDPNIFAMLAKVGTTISWESDGTTQNTPRQSIKCFRKDSLSADEILLEFDTAITEVLPLRILMQQESMLSDHCMKFDMKN